MKKALLMLAISTVFIACNSSLDKKFSDKTTKEDIQTILEETDSTSYKLIVSSILRYGLQGKKLEDYTYRELLEEGKRWKAEQEKTEQEHKALAEKAALEESKRVKRLQEVVFVTCYKKGYKEYDYRDYITYGFAFNNKTNKDIRAVKGSILFNDLFDEKISSLNLTYDSYIIPAGTSINWEATSDYNQFLDTDVRLKNKDLKDLKVVWIPEKIIFVDGTTME